MNKKILASVLLASLVVTLSTLPFTVVKADTTLGCGETGGNEKLDTIVQNVGDAAQSIGAGLAVVGFIIAGILWLTSAGSPEKTGLAKKALIAAAIGAALVAVAGAADIMTDIFCAIIGE